MIAEASPKDPAVGGAPAQSLAWAGSALLVTSVVAVLAKIAGVVVAPGLRGIASQATMELADTVSGALAFLLAGLLVALVCGASFELARSKRIAGPARGTVVVLSGLVLAVVSPAVVTRLHDTAALTLAIVASVIALISGIVVIRAKHTRAAGAILVMLALCGLLRPMAWEAATLGGERPSLALFHAGTVLAAIAVIVHGLAVLLAAAWLGTRSLWRGRILANLAIVAAFAVTYLAARQTDSAPSGVEAVLNVSLVQTIAVSLPYGIAAIAAFLVPASILLAAVSLVQRAQPPAVIAPLALALISHGSFDVPLQALAIIAAAQWTMLAMADERSVWTTLIRERREAPTTN